MGQDRFRPEVNDWVLHRVGPRVEPVLVCAHSNIIVDCATIPVDLALNTPGFGQAFRQLVQMPV